MIWNIISFKFLNLVLQKKSNNQKSAKKWKKNRQDSNSELSLVKKRCVVEWSMPRAIIHLLTHKHTHPYDVSTVEMFRFWYTTGKLRALWVRWMCKCVCFMLFTRRGAPVLMTILSSSWWVHIQLSTVKKANSKIWKISNAFKFAKKKQNNEINNQ